MHKHTPIPARGLGGTLNSTWGTSARQAVDCVVPAPAEPWLIAALAGDWWHASRETLRPLLFQLAADGFSAAALGHRLFDEIPNGVAMRKDVLESLTRAREDAALAGWEGRTALLGSGSGSLLALLTAQSLCSQGKHAIDALIVVGVPAQVQRWDGCPDRVWRQVGRFHGLQAELDPLDGDCSRLPPICILAGEDAEEAPISAVQAFASALRERGAQVTVLQQRHGRCDVLENPLHADAQHALKGLREWLHDLQPSEQGLPRMGEPLRIQPLTECDPTASRTSKHDSDDNEESDAEETVPSETT